MNVVLANEKVVMKERLMQLSPKNEAVNKVQGLEKGGGFAD